MHGQQNVKKKSTNNISIQSSPTAQHHKKAEFLPYWLYNVTNLELL